MATSSKKNVGGDRARVSAQKHEIATVAAKLPKKKTASGASRVRAAKAKLGRTVSRKKVEEAAMKQ